MSKEWTVGPVKINTDRGKGYVVPGWVNGVFGIDVRYGSFGVYALVVTHLKTGYIVSAFTDDLERVKLFADALLEHGDWDFTEIADCKPYSEPVRALRKGLTKVNANDFYFLNHAELAA